MNADGEPVYLAGLQDVSGTFTGEYDPEVAAEVLGLFPVSPLIPVLIDTGGQPNPAAMLPTALTIRVNDTAWTLPVDHVDLLGSNKVRLWLRRPASPHDDG